MTNIPQTLTLTKTIRLLYSVTNFKKLIKYIDDYQIIIGSRNSTREGAPVIRKIMAKGFIFIRNSLIGLKGIKDTQCGFKCFSKKAAENVFSRAKIDGFAFDVEILKLAKRFNYKIKEVPITWVNDLESKVKLKHVFKMFVEMLKLRKDLIMGKYGKK